MVLSGAPSGEVEAPARRRLQTGAPAAPSAETLTSPPVLRNASEKPGVVELDLTAAPSRLELVPGKPTTAWAYNGTVPGPTIELREGDIVTIHFHNKLAQTDDGPLARAAHSGRRRRQSAESGHARREPGLRLQGSRSGPPARTGITRIPT